MLSVRSSATLSTILMAPMLLAQFAPELDIPLEGPRTVEVIDLDADGDKDLLLGSRSGIVVLANVDGQGNWSQPITLSNDQVLAHATDLDGDGNLDVVLAEDQGGGVYWRRNLGGLQFAAPQVVIPNGTVRGLVSADLDGDSDTDLALLFWDGTVQVSLNMNGAGLFGPLAPVGFTPGADRLSVVDFDGSGRPDLLWSSPLLGETHVAMSQWAGAYGAPQLVNNEGFAVVEDLDGDGRVDLLGADPLAGKVFWRRLLGQTAGTASTIDMGLQCTRMEATDLDGDGDNDLIVALQADGAVAWYENLDGQGLFGPRQDIANGAGDVHAIAAGDVDGDGDAEVFFASGVRDGYVWSENLAVAQDRIVGRVFNDLNGDGLFNGNDHGLSQVAVELPGDRLAYTNLSGVFTFDVSPGTHDVHLSAPSGWALNGSGQRTVVVAPPQNCALGVDFALHAVGTNLELRPDLSTATLRCDQQIPYWLRVTNTGNRITDAVATLQLDALSGFVSADPAPDVVVNGVAVWRFDGLQPTHHRQVRIHAQMPDWQLMGSTLVDLAMAEAEVNGQSMGSFQTTVSQELDCSYDPNDKQVLPRGQGAQGLTPMGSTLVYTIRFQNTGNAEAFEVELVDQLHPDLLVGSLKVLGSSHPMEVSLGTTGELRVRYPDIMLPDSASDPVGSQGYFRFSVEHAPGLPEGTEVTNTASIYFDTNPAIITNTVLNTLTYGVVGIAEGGLTDGLEVHPNPVQDNAVVRLGEEFQGRTDLLLSDALGRTVRAWSISGDRAELRGEDLPSGLYLLRAVGREGTERVVRVLMD